LAYHPKRPRLSGEIRSFRYLIMPIKLGRSSEGLSKSLFVCVVVLVSPVVSAEEPSIPRFYADYAVVQHNLKNDQGLFGQLMEFAKAYPREANFIADFWWGRAKKECSTTFSEVAKRYAKAPSKSPTERAKLEKDAMKEADQCIYGVYYDHWDEINKMIEQRFRKLKEDKNR